MNSDSFVKTEDLTRIYSSGTIEVTALKDVSLSLDQGQFLGVTGASGSGKSTLMNPLAGLVLPSSGSITVQGKLISELDKDELALYRRHQVGMIFQSFNLVSSYTRSEERRVGKECRS